MVRPGMAGNAAWITPSYPKNFVKKNRSSQVQRIIHETGEKGNFRQFGVYAI
jgi:hypothetical protein